MDSFVVRMRDGPLLPTAVVLWIVQAHDRGLRFRLVGSRVEVRPQGALTDGDRTFLRVYPREVLDAVDYIARTAVQPIVEIGSTEAVHRREAFRRQVEGSRRAGTRAGPQTAAPREGS